MNLIREIRLPNGRTTKNLGFGCAGILRLPLPNQREKLLRTACDAGLTHFDVARMYGAGAAEGIVGSSLKNVRSELTFATKFGFPCGVPSRRKIMVQSLVRWAVNLHPSIKKFLKRSETKGSLDRFYDYSLEEMKRSLETSLTELQLDRLDLFFVHEPRAHDALPDLLAASLREQKALGRIGSYGLSGLPSDITYFMQHRPELCGDALQYNFSLDHSVRPLSQPMPYTGVFHVLSGTLPALMKYLGEHRDFAQSWSDQLSLDLTASDHLAATILALALNEMPDRMVLFFTSSPKRIRRLVYLLTNNSFTPEVLSAFRSEISLRSPEIYAL